jgi:hypothetical protein
LHFFAYLMDCTFNCTLFSLRIKGNLAKRIHPSLVGRFTLLKGTDYLTSLAHQRSACQGFLEIHRANTSTLLIQIMKARACKNCKNNENLNNFVCQIFLIPCSNVKI